jgi:4-amino-4-deoxy-L-arabinose transferase-like glycosyltransferase
MNKLSFAHLIKNPYCLIFLLCAVSFAPFSNKAFQMDSPVTVYMARQMTHNIWNPPLGAYGRLLSFWNHTDLPQTSAFYATPHPPLVPLYLTAFVAIFGENERALNWAMFPFFFFSAVFFFLIASLYVPRWRFESTLLFIASPVVFVNAQDVMLDVPLMLFCMGAFYFLFRSRTPRDAVIAGLFSAFACLTKFTGGTVVVSGILFYVLSKRWKECCLFLFPFVILYGLWTAHNALLWGKIQLLSNGHAHYIAGDVRYRFERLLSYAGGTIVVPVVPLLFSICMKKYRLAAMLGIAASSLWAFLLVNRLHYSVSSAALYALCASAGVVLLYGIFVFTLADENKPRGISLFLHVLLQVLGGGFLTLYSSRYLLPIVFVFVLFLATLVEAMNKGLSKKIVWITLIASSAVVSVLLAISDYQFVNAERRAASDVRRLYPHEQVYYSGRLGYLYYADRAGFTSMLSGRATPQGGDILLKNPVSHDDACFFTDTTQLALLAKLRYPMIPFRAMTGRAGFYGDDRLPYAWVTSPEDRVFLLYRKK